MASRQVALEPGSVLDDRFVIDRVLGQGESAVVVVADDRKLGRPVALKLLRPEHAQKPQLAAHFLAQARIARRLRHEHIVRILEVDVLRTGQPFLVMEYAPGVDLAEHLRRSGPLPVDQVVDYVLQGLEALAEAHYAGVAHLNLSPRNLLLTSREDDSATIKLTDFGLSLASGSPAYWSPERLSQAGQADFRADIWSIGVVAYELLSGRRPFSGDTARALLASIAQTQPEALPPPVPQELARVLSRCLEKQPEHRYQNVAELARALAPLASQLSSRLSIERILRVKSSLPPASRAEWTPPLAKSSARGPDSWRRRVITAIIVAATLCVVAYALHQGRAPRREGPRSVFSRTEPAAVRLICSSAG